MMMDWEVDMPVYRKLADAITPDMAKILDRLKEGHVIVYRRPSHKKGRYEWDDGKPVDAVVLVYLVHNQFIRGIDNSWLVLT